MLVLLLSILAPDTANASNNVNILDKRKVTIIYYGTDDRTLANVHFLDSTLSGIFQSVELIEFDQIEKGDWKSKDIVVFYSSKEVHDPHALNILKDFKGFVLGIGNGAKGLPQFKTWEFFGSTTIQLIDGDEINYPSIISRVKAPKNAQQIIYGQGFNEELPIIIHEGSTAFITIDQFISIEKYAISKGLLELFRIKKSDTHPAYLRLEDISPIADPELVSKAGNYLIDKGIPVYLAVIPVYIDPDSGEKITLGETPKLRKVLDQLVERGAYIIAHGYTHNYRYEETGEGFEFWDSKANQPISTLDNKQEVERIKKKDEFPTYAEYEAYFRSIKEIETEYTKSKLEKSINTLTELGYAPIAFEAPHYTMSSNGYRVTSQYFSTIFGQLQTSDNNWRVMTSPLFISKASIINGMTLYPETIGFVDENVVDPIGEIENNLDHVIKVPGAVIGGIYHPYLGLDYLKELVALLESVPNIEWIRIDDAWNFVKTDKVQITMPGNGEINVVQNFTWTLKLSDYAKENPFETALWGIVFLTSLFVILFLLHIFTLRIRYRKRLFKERV